MIMTKYISVHSESYNVRRLNTIAGPLGWPTALLRMICELMQF